MATLYINAVIDRKPETAFLVDEGLFQQLGSNDEILALQKEGDEVVDLCGQFVLPGFIDSHMHLLHLGYYLTNLRLDGVTSIEELLNKVRQRTVHTPTDRWVIGMGYNETYFDEIVEPTKEMLDAISTEIPIALQRSCVHVMVVNSKALELAGITAETNERGVHFDTGRMEEEAQSLIMNQWPEADTAVMMAYIQNAAKYLASFGVTSVGSDDLVSLSADWKLAIDAYMKLSYQHKLKVRVNEQCRFEKVDDFAAFLDEGYTTGVGDECFNIGPLKLILDGSLGARTAAMSQPYADAPGKLGSLDHSDEEVETYVALANRFNMPTIAHTIGDRSADQILDVYQNHVLKGNPLGHGLVHCQILRPEQTEQIIKLNLNCYVQTLFFDSDAQILEARIGKARAKTSYPFKTLYDHVNLSNGSDAPVETPNPLRGIQMAVTGRSITDPSYTMNLDQCLTVEEAIDSYTINGAKAFGWSDVTGRIAQGYYADFVVLNQDITRVPAAKISEAKVTMTVCGGEVTFE